MIGARAREDVREQLAPATVGDLVKARLQLDRDAQRVGVRARTRGW